MVYEIIRSVSIFRKWHPLIMVLIFVGVAKKRYNDFNKKAETLAFDNAVLLPRNV